MLPAGARLPQQRPAFPLLLLAIVVAAADRGQILGGTGNCAALQGAGDRGRRNAQVGGGLPWRDASRQCSGQLFRRRRKQLVLGRLSRGRLAQLATELATVLLAAIAGKPDCFLLQGAVQIEPGNPQVVGPPGA